MKLIGISMILISCALGGFVIDGYEKKRIKELEKFIYTFEILRAEIDYRLTPLEEACLYISKFSTLAISKILHSFAEALKSRNSADIEIMWERAVNDHKGEFHLNKDDYETLYSFGKACGYLDKNMQDKNIQMLISTLKDELEQSRAKYQKNTKLNKSLGILIGVCISIFLI